MLMMMMISLFYLLTFFYNVLKTLILLIRQVNIRNTDIERRNNPRCWFVCLTFEEHFVVHVIIDVNVLLSCDSVFKKLDCDFLCYHTPISCGCMERLDFTFLHRFMLPRKNMFRKES